MASASDSNSVPVKSVGSFTATADPGLGLARVAIFIMRFLGCAGSGGAATAGSRATATAGSEAATGLARAATAGLARAATGLARAALFFPNNPLTTVIGSAELGFISNCSASNVAKLASAPVAFLIGIFEKLFPFGFFGCSACGRGMSDI